MDDNTLRKKIITSLWAYFAETPFVLSATIAGSFSRGTGLDGIADIDTIVIVSELTESRFVELQKKSQECLAPILAEAGYQLRINPTLGPLKFNDPQTAVLHLMIYDAEAHRNHVINSPFTCYDWQTSPIFMGHSLKKIYPVFALQPRHFISARRSAKDYLADLLNASISYREIVFRNDKRSEIKHSKAMTLRDSHEFAFHIIRFLMLNFYKLVNRTAEGPDEGQLVNFYFSLFPAGQDEIIPIYKTLKKMKSEQRFDQGVEDLQGLISRFVKNFEQQFRSVFYAQAIRHVFFRHAPTQMNMQTGADTIFQGRSDTSIIENPDLIPNQLRKALVENSIRSCLVSPLKRTTETVAMLNKSGSPLPENRVIPELVEIDYGKFEGNALEENKKNHPKIFAAWSNGEDPDFPGGGENTNKVHNRLQTFLKSGQLDASGTAVCTHNIVLRCLIGDHFNLPPAQWHRLKIPHLMPIILIETLDFGSFIELGEDVERIIFEDFYLTEDRQS